MISLLAYSVESLDEFLDLGEEFREITLVVHTLDLFVLGDGEDYGGSFGDTDCEFLQSTDQLFQRVMELFLECLHLLFDLLFLKL